MSSKKINLKGIGPRLIGWSTLLLTLSLIFVSTTVYYLLSSTLRENGRSYLQRLALSYAQAIKVNPSSYQFKNEIAPELMVKVIDQDGRTELFSHLPEFIERDFDDADEIKQIDRDQKKIKLAEGFATVLLESGEEDDDIFQELEWWLRKYTLKHGWTNILPMIDNDLFEVYTMPLEAGGWIRVGSSSEEAEEHLSDIRKISMVVIIPFIFIGFIANYILSRTILAPLKNLATTIEDVKNGNHQARGKISGNGDEVDLLSGEFNSLLDQNDKLITNLKSTIDNVAHDLRTPLTRFRSSVESALTQKSDPEIYREALQDGLENADKIRELLDAIMDVSEAETQTMRLKRESLNMKEVIENLVELYQYSAEDKNISIQAHMQDEVRVSADRVRIMQAMGNLLDNALKYSAPNTQVNISLGVEDHTAVIEIKDQGMGIDESDREKIWERLYRADKSRSTSGLGIGLSVVKAIVKAHGGSISVESRLGEGSSFKIKLPIGNV